MPVEREVAQEYIDFAIEESLRQGAIKDFFHTTYTILKQWGAQNGNRLTTRYITLPSNVADIKLRLLGIFDDSSLSQYRQATIEGTVSPENRPVYIYNFSLTPEGTAADKRVFVSLEEIKQATKRVGVIERLLESKPAKMPPSWCGF